MALWRRQEPGKPEEMFPPNEKILGRTNVDVFHASVTPVYEKKQLAAVLTSERVCLVNPSRILASWPWADLQPRTTSSQGKAIGQFAYVLTLFSDGGEVISFGFNTESARDAFDGLIQSTAA